MPIPPPANSTDDPIINLQLPSDDLTNFTYNVTLPLNASNTTCSVSNYAGQTLLACALLPIGGDLEFNFFSCSCNTQSNSQYSSQTQPATDEQTNTTPPPPLVAVSTAVMGVGVITLFVAAMARSYYHFVLTLYGSFAVTAFCLFSFGLHSTNNCYAFAALTHFFILATGGCMAMLGAYMATYMRNGLKHDSGVHQYIKAGVAVVALPAIALGAGIAAAQDNYVHPSACWPSPANGWFSQNMIYMVFRW